jgi:chemotaxis protein methyltransferase CheR
MVSDSQPISVKVVADAGMIDSSRAVSIGLIVTELLINAFKYAFPVSRTGAEVVISYAIDGAAWTLVIADNGIGKDSTQVVSDRTGLGTAIVKALTDQLGAGVAMQTSDKGLSVSITSAPVLPSLLAV